MISGCFEVSSVAALLLIPQQKMTTVRDGRHEIATMPQLKWEFQVKEKGNLLLGIIELS